MGSIIGFNSPSLYVMFEMTEPGLTVYVDKLPGGWLYVGSSDLLRKSTQIEDEFSGPSRGMPAAARKLKKVFRKFEEDGIVSEFYIRKRSALRPERN